jgi:alpha-L-rhamnosidase
MKNNEFLLGGRPLDRLWQAKWIWAAHEGPNHNVYVEARTSFELGAGQVKEALLHISANQEYKVYLNGREIGRGPSPSDNAWQYFDTYDVASDVRAGKNTIALLAYNFGDQDIVTQQLQGPGGVIAELEIGSGDLRTVIATNGDWKARRSTRWVEGVSRQHLWNGFKEIYLAAQEDSWETLDYDDKGWAQAKVVADACDANSSWPRLLPREIPFLHQEWIYPSKVSGAEPYNGTIMNPTAMLEDGAASPTEGMVMDASFPGSLPAVTFDFEKERVGYMELDVTATEGGVLQLYYGESFDLSLYDTFILKKGLNRLRPFGRRAFRYVKVTAQATTAAITIHRLGVRSVRYPFQAGGTFRCDDPVVERIWETGRYTTLVNSQDHLEDCPLREKALWIVDAIVMGKVIYQTFGDSRLLRKCLLQGARIQNEDGSIPGTGPERNSFLLPDFCAHWLFGVADYWHYTSDDGFLQEVWPTIRRLVDWFEAQEDEDGLFSRADRDGWWCFIDWADYLDKRDKVTAVSCFHYRMLRFVAEMAKALGDESFAKRSLQRSERLYNAIRRHFWLPERNVFVDCKTKDGLSLSITAQTNFVAIWSGIMTAEEAECFLTKTFFTDQCPPIKGAFFYHIVLETLLDYGYVDQALGRIQSYWGEMLKRGATTWWETFDPTTPRSTVPSPFQGNTPTYLADHIPVSFCHGWGAAPTYLLTQRILGVDVSRMGSRTARLNPYVPARMHWAEGTVPTPWGDIRARWERQDNGEVTFEAELPAAIKWSSSFLERQTTVQIGDKQQIRGTVSAETIRLYNKPATAIM